MDGLWAALLAAAYFLKRRNPRGAWVIFGPVLSHWLLDWISHRPDMPLVPGLHRYFGLGLWGKRLDTDVRKLTRSVAVAQRCCYPQRGPMDSGPKARWRIALSNHSLLASGFSSSSSFSRGSHLPRTNTPLGCFRVSKFSSGLPAISSRSAR
jgi:hypothetical protein